MLLLNTVSKYYAIATKSLSSSCVAQRQFFIYPAAWQGCLTFAFLITLRFETFSSRK
jgi:hypothetical protein